MRFINILISLVAFAASASAITITQPMAGDQVDFSKSYTIKWTTVASDPSNFTIVLVNMNSQPNVSKQIANVKTSDNSYTVDKVTGIPVANGYQLNAESNTTTNTGILSQSQQFNVTKVGKVETTSSATTSATQTAAASTSSAGSASYTGPLSGSVAVFGALAMGVLGEML
ncbi:GPI anchored serine-threonine rich family protein [Aspergillus ibericus CBS 121593]|uniref:Threonine rich protein n=1 Tax=Aspergillus ibericus CBS 121593 TaxID=1448316 RepID=A0A395GQD8_9EURO|nr:threonine rich protein [Aspergillus ibericus CBS 121593]RAK97715.1 threonine rich protein [Aspergillus ibericus CBS 121593]